MRRVRPRDPLTEVRPGGEPKIRPPPSDLGRALFSQALLVLRGHPGVAPWLSHEGLTKFEGGLGHELVPPGAVLRQGSPIREGRQEVEVGQVAFLSSPELQG